MQDFTKLRAWHAGHRLAVDISRVFTYKRCRPEPGFRAQILKAARSIPTNIAEGCGRRSPADLARFVDTSCGSASELRYHLIYALDVGILPPATHVEFEARLEVVSKMLFGLAESVRDGNRRE